MKLNEYQQKAVSTAIYSDNHRLIYPALGLCGESGEVAEKVKKVLRDCDGDVSTEKRNEIAKEIGDVLWYIANLANDLDYDLEDIAQMNIDKLFSRKERGVIGGSGDNR